MLHSWKVTQWSVEIGLYSMHELCQTYSSETKREILLQADDHNKLATTLWKQLCPQTVKVALCQLNSPLPCC
jgi:hypothetical protein